MGGGGLSVIFNWLYFLPLLSTNQSDVDVAYDQQGSNDEALEISYFIVYDWIELVFVVCWCSDSAVEARKHHRHNIVISNEGEFYFGNISLANNCGVPGALKINSHYACEHWAYYASYAV